MSTYNCYRKAFNQPMFPWNSDTDMTNISVSEEDLKNGSPKEGDMIAFNPDDLSDKWLVARDFFRENYVKVESTLFISDEVE